MKAVAKDAAGRYASAREFQLAIEDWLLRERLPASQAHLADFMARVYPHQPDPFHTPADTGGVDATLVRTPAGTSKTPSSRRDTSRGGLSATMMSANAASETTSAKVKRSAVWVVMGALAMAVPTVWWVNRKAEAPPPPLVEVPKTVRLEVLSEPVRDLDVLVDGKRLGATPFRQELPAKKVAHVRVEGRGIVPKEDDVRFDQDVTLEIHPTFPEVAIESDPPGAQAAIEGGRALGPTPTKFVPESPNPVKLSLSLKGYKTRTVDYDPAHPTELRALKLEKAAAGSGNDPFHSSSQR
jgi:hypothetical protein